MFEQEDIQQSLTTGRRLDPSFINIRNLVKNNAVRIENRIMSIDRTTTTDHPVITILAILNLNPFMSYEDVEWKARSVLPYIGNSFRFSSVGEFGTVKNSTVIKGQDDLIVLTLKPVNPRLSFKKLSPLRFLYHDYTNLDWCIGTTYIPETINILELNLVALAWQYVLYLRTLSEDVRKLPMNVYVYRYVVFKSIASYFNLSIYNRHMNYQRKRDVPKYENSREIPIPVLDPFIDKHVKNTNDHLVKANMLPGELLSHFNFAYTDRAISYPNALGLVCQTSHTKTAQERWLYQLVNFKLAADVLEFNHEASEKFKTRLKRDLIAFRQSRVIDKMPKHLNLHIKSIFLERLELLLK